ncbi:MAG: MFS transporter [Geodermatophilaceae bacterium]|nr:MFS transporter [Geodermatophilaceae bacterium]
MNVSIASLGAAGAGGRGRRGPRHTPRARVGGTVFALGTVSLLTDVSSEMVAAVLPIYLTIALGLSPLAFGVIDGVYHGATVFVRLAGGYVSDRIGRPKAVAQVGYGLSAVTKLGFISAGSQAGALTVMVALDRSGKGIRTAPRDALIAGSVHPSILGRAFGVHRAK